MNPTPAVRAAHGYPPSNWDARPSSDSKFRVCEQCWLVQIDEVLPPSQLFSDCAYFSSYSNTRMSHAKEFAEVA